MIAGGGLAGSEAAWQLAQRGFRVSLYEMRPVQTTDAHQTDRLAELVCSNSLKSDQHPSASWLLKEELRRLDSLLMRAANEARVPGGQALTVDRVAFADVVTDAIEAHPLIEIRREEVTAIDASRPTIIATGPLTAGALAGAIGRADGVGQAVFLRQHQSDCGCAYNRPLDCICGIELWQVAGRQGRLSQLPVRSSPVRARLWMRCWRRRARRRRISRTTCRISRRACRLRRLRGAGRDTLRFGPMKPMGLVDPATGRRPWAVVQLRQENLRADSYNLVGFQNHLKFAGAEAGDAA